MNQTTFSIIIPTHQRPHQLTECLSAISKIDYPRRLFEVIIVDDGATISEDLIAPFRNEINITWHSQKQTGPATARNNGANLSKCEFIAFLDDDCVPQTDWLNAFDESFRENPNLLLGGKIINALPKNIYSTASQLLVDFLYNYFAQSDSPIQFFTSNNIAISRQNFQNLEGFDGTFPLPAAEDRDFCRRWRKLGGKLQFVPSAQIFHAHHLNFRGFWRQHFNYGRGAFHFHKLRAIDENEKVKIEPFGFYKNLILYPFKEVGWGKGIILSILFMVSQIATASGFFYQKFTE